MQGINLLKKKPLATKAIHQFHHGAGYMEMDIDCHSMMSSSRENMHIAAKNASDLSVDIGIVVQGEKEGLAVDAFIGCVNIRGMDLTRMPFLMDLIQFKKPARKNVKIGDSFHQIPLEADKALLSKRAQPIVEYGPPWTWVHKPLPALGA